MAKKLYVVHGVGNNADKQYNYTFCKVFRSEKKADKYYDKKYLKLLEEYASNIITYYNIDYNEFKIK